MIKLDGKFFYHEVGCVCFKALKNECYFDSRASKARVLIALHMVFVLRWRLTEFFPGPHEDQSDN